MDAARFDSLAKTFTAALTRRRALTGLIGAGFSALLRVPHGAAKPKDKDKPCKKDKHCTAGQRCCAGACVDLQTDPKNCGRCGNDCSTCHSCGGECCAGVCGLCFAAGQVCCDGSYCAPLSPTMDTCEICGHPCAPDEVCCGPSTCSVDGVC
jgi:hypothetical protein